MVIVSQRGALLRLVEDVEMLDGEAVVTPAVPSLDAARWENSTWQIGHGYASHWNHWTAVGCRRKN